MRSDAALLQQRQRGASTRCGASTRSAAASGSSGGGQSPRSASSTGQCQDWWAAYLLLRTAAVVPRHGNGGGRRRCRWRLVPLHAGALRGRRPRLEGVLRTAMSQQALMPTAARPATFTAMTCMRACTLAHLAGSGVLLCRRRVRFGVSVAAGPRTCWRAATAGCSCWRQRRHLAGRACGRRCRGGRRGAAAGWRPAGAGWCDSLHVQGECSSSSS